MIQLTRRERRLAIGVTAAVVLWAAYGFGIAPVQDRIEDLTRLIPEKENELRDIRAKSAEYMRLRHGLEEVQMRMAQQDPDFDLLAFAQSMLEESGLSTHATMDGYGTVVKINLEDIAMQQLVEFLKAVQDSDAVAQVGSLHVHRDAVDKTLLDSSLEIYSPDPDQFALAADLVRL